MKKTAKYYAATPEARAKKATYQKAYNAKPEEKLKRAKLNKANRDRGTYGNGDGKDLSHTTKGLVLKPQSVNRGSKKDQPGDKRARGGKKS